MREEIFRLNALDQVCDKHELDWPIKGWKINMRKMAKLLFMSGTNGGKPGVFKARKNEGGGTTS